MFYAGHMGGFSFFGMILFWGLFIWLIIWLIQQNSSPRQRQKTPLEIARERLAKGDINKKEFEEIKKDL